MPFMSLLRIGNIFAMTCAHHMAPQRKVPFPALLADMREAQKIDCFGLDSRTSILAKKFPLTEIIAAEIIQFASAGT